VYENSSSFVVHTIRMRSACVGGVKSGNQVQVGIMWWSTLARPWQLLGRWYVFWTPISSSSNFHPLSNKAFNSAVTLLSSCPSEIFGCMIELFQICFDAKFVQLRCVRNRRSGARNWVVGSDRAARAFMFPLMESVQVAPHTYVSII
jgi:hypothetical protein